MSVFLRPAIAAVFLGCTLSPSLCEWPASNVSPPPNGGRDRTSIGEDGSLQSLLDSGVKTVDIGSTGVIQESVTVPAGVTLRASGATLVPPPGAAYAVRTGGEGARIVGVKVDATRDSNMIGGETAFLIEHSGATLKGSSVVGNNYRYGVVLNSKRGPLKNVSISGNTFTRTSYGVLKKGIRTVSLRIEQNVFTDIRRGDAIELDTGGESGTVIRFNTIDGVHRDNTVNAGLGIGIAGEGGYGVPASNMTSGCVISDNRISNVEQEAIHVEKMRLCQVERNTITAAKGSRTGIGIALYGTKHMLVKSNNITETNVGIFDALGVTAGHYIRSASGNVTSSNRISKCDTGIMSMVAGDHTSFAVNSNAMSNCKRGIVHWGATKVAMAGNITRETPYPYTVDLLPSNTRHLGIATRSLTFNGNSAYRNGRLVRRPLRLTNASGASFKVTGPSVAQTLGHSDQSGL